MTKKAALNPNEKSERQHFDKLAKRYDKNYTYNSGFTQYKIQKKLNILFEEVSKKKKLKILELGAGTGEYTQHLATLFPNAEISAIDISPKILAIAKKKCRQYRNVSFKVASAYSLPYKEKSFDIVCGFYILHHLEQKKTMREIYRVLKPEGQSFFYEPNILNPAVLAIKSIPALKERAGDSPEEWGINPLGLNKYEVLFEQVNWQTSEFIIAPAGMNEKLAIQLDEFFSWLGKLPILRWLGGSVAIKITK
jgi:ubiquinone/menaquinone biosynthesis C-methylase UbiE